MIMFDFSKSVFKLWKYYEIYLPSGFILRPQSLNAS